MKSLSTRPAPLALSLFGALALAACSQQKASDPGAQTASAPAHEGHAAPAAAEAAAQPTRGENPGDREQTDPDGVVRRGAQLSAGEALSIAQAFEQAKTLNGKTVKLTGTVKSVCAKKGCWFEVHEGDRSVRITAQGYGFFMPSKIEGWKATIEGPLALKTLDQATAQHFEDDKAAASGRPARKVEGPVEELGIEAVGVELKQGG
jgi:hypothetical protein